MVPEGLLRDDARQTGATGFAPNVVLGRNRVAHAGERHLQVCGRVARHRVVFARRCRPGDEGVQRLGIVWWKDSVRGARVDDGGTPAEMGCVAVDAGIVQGDTP